MLSFQVGDGPKQELEMREHQRLLIPPELEGSLYDIASGNYTGRKPR